MTNTIFQKIQKKFRKTDPADRKKWKKWSGKKLKKWGIAAVILVVLIALAASLLLNGRGNAASRADYIQETVETRTITSSLVGSGTLQPADAYTVTTLVEGEVLSADFEEGDVVEKDTVLYQIDSSDVDNNIEKSQITMDQAQRSYDSAVEKCYVKAAISGQLYSLDVKVGDEVTQGQALGTIRQSDTMTLVVPFPADDDQRFSVGQAAVVTLDNSFETLNGTVKSISGSDIVGTGNMVTRNVTISVKNPGGLGAEQSATASIGGIGCAAPSTFTYPAESTLTAAAAGTVVSLQVQEGGSVSKDQTVLTLGGDTLEENIQSAQESLRNAELSMDTTQNQQESYTITSPIQGTIVDKQYKAGDTYRAGDNMEGGNVLCTIYDLSYLEMTIDIDELDISEVTVGQSVQITAEAVEGQTYTGVITKVSLLGTTGTSGATTYPVTVQLDEYEGLRPGMNVDAEIVLDKAADVLAIASQAVSRGDLVLVTADSPSASNAADQEAPEGYVYVEVKTGLSDDRYTQILSGLQAGDTVAYKNEAAASTTTMMEPPTGTSGSGMSGGMSGGMGSGMGGGMSGSTGGGTGGGQTE